MANRYAQLVAGVPSGSFYASAGDVLPFKSDPYQFLLAPVGANHTFEIYVNDVFRGQTTSNAAGQATVTVLLGQGDQSIVLKDLSDGSMFRAPGVTIRLYATPMAAEADVFGSLDASLDEIEQSMALETATPNLIGDVFGRPLSQPNDLGVYLTDTYRRLLFRLRQGFRLFGAKKQGVRQIVFGYTGSQPFIVPHAWQPNWVLGYQLAPNGDMQAYARTTDPVSAALANANQRVPGWVHAAFGGAPTIFPGPFVNPPVPQVLEVVFGAGWNGGAVMVFGTDPSGFAVNDTFVPVTVPGTVIGQRVFKTVANATKGAGAVGTASIGLGSTRFLVVVQLGADNIIGAQNLAFIPAAGPLPDRLNWGGGPAVSIAATALPPNGQVTLHDQDKAADWFGLKYGNYTLDTPVLVATGTETYLALEFDGKGIIVCDLTDTVHGGPSAGPSPRTAAQVAAVINFYLAADARYGATYGTVATAAADLAGNGTVVRLTCPGPSGGAPVGPGDNVTPGSSVKIHPWGADGAEVVFGEPRFAAAMSVVPTYRGVSLTVPGGSRLPEVVGPIILHVAVLDSSTITLGGFATPRHPGPVQVYFDGAWHAGTVRVQGAAFGGAVQTEDILLPYNVVLSGVDADVAADGKTISFAIGDFNLHTEQVIKAGMFIRILSGPNAGAGGYVRYVRNAGVPFLFEAVLGNVLPAPSTVNQQWEARRDVIGQGVLAFQGVTQLVNVAPAGAPVGATPAGRATLSVLDGNTAGWAARIGRSPRVLGAGAPGDILTAAVDPTHAVYAFQPTTLTVTEITDAFFLIRGAANPGNDGLHPVVGFGSVGGAGGNELTLEHQEASLGGTFTTETFVGGTLVLYSAGEVVQVVDYNRGTGAIVLYPPGAQVVPLVQGRVEVAGELPFIAPGVAGPGTITVAVDRNALPAAGTSDSVAISGVAVPDHYLATNQAADAVDVPGYFNASRFTMQGSGVDSNAIGTTDMTLDVELPEAVVRAYRGLVLRASFWVQQHMTLGPQPFRVDFSYYTGVGGLVGLFVIGTAVPGSTSANPEPVPNTMLDVPAPGFGGSLDPHLVEAQFEVPFNAERLTVRLRHLGTAAATPNAYASVERLIVVGLQGTGYYLGENTVPMNAHQGAFGDVLYVWSPEPLNVAERTALGLPQPPATPLSYPVVQGQIDRVVEAQGFWSRFDVSEYTPGLPRNLPVNVLGAYGQVAWSGAALTNMEIAVGVPARLTVVRPAKVSLIRGEVLQIVAPSNARVAEISGHEGIIRGSGADGSLSLATIGGGNMALRDPNRVFPAGIVGQTLTLRGAFAPVNDGPYPPLHTVGFLIIAVVGGGNTIHYTNPDGVDEPTFLGEYEIATFFPEESFSEELLIENPASVVLAAGNGTQISISAPNNGVQTLTNPDVLFSTRVVGQTLTLSGAGPAANRGDFTVLAQTATPPDPHSVMFSNPLGVSEPMFAGTYIITPSAVLGLPVPATPSVVGGVLPWRWLDSTHVQIASVAAGDPGDQAVFNPASTYTINYRRLTRAQPVAFDLGAAFADYVWLYDAAIYLRREPGSTPFSATEQLTFLANFQATPSNRSNNDQNQAVLTSDNGVTKTIVPVANWRFVDAQTVGIDPGVFDGTLVYVLTYVALEPEYPAPAQVVIEARSSSVSLADVLTQPWRPVQIDDVAPQTDRYHQVRVTITGVVDVRDIEIAGLGLRGVHLYGAGAYAPGVLVP